LKTHNQSDRPYVLHTRVVTKTGGGPEKTILNSPRFLRRYGIDSCCVFMHPPDDEGFATIEKRAAESKAEIIGVPDKGAFDWRAVRRLVRICKERNVTIWHGHDYKSNALGLLVQQFHPMHLVTTAHGWVQFRDRLPMYYRVDRFCMKRYQQVMCVSDDLMDRCRAHGIRQDRLTQIDNAIVLEDYETSPPSVSERARFGFGTDHVLIGAVGRLSEEKAFHHLIFAVSRLVRDGHPVGLIVAGEGPLQQQLQQQIVDLDLQGHVRLLGYLADPRPLYRAIDLFALSSVREGLPNVILEAMASSRAIVATDCNGVPSVIENNVNGLVVRKDSSAALYEAMSQCVVSDAQRERLAANGRRTVQERFCFANRMQSVVNVYRRLSPEVAAQIGSHPSHCIREDRDSDPRMLIPVGSL
jgi:glycosyltransferase involved in cell wall biosynthesis